MTGEPKRVLYLLDLVESELRGRTLTSEDSVQLLARLQDIMETVIQGTTPLVKE